MSVPRTLRLVLQYDGTRYVGWERQSNGLSVQEVLETALQRITQESVETHASGRTDAGVHAHGQVVSLVLCRRMLPAKLRLGLNAVLPEDVAVLAVEEVPENFHARKSAKSKHYRYTILNDSARRPLLRHTSFHVPQKLNHEAMHLAAQALVGKHDFSAFAKEARKKKSCVRTVLHAAVCRDGVLLHVDITGTGFLYNMVRIITGTLIEVGLGKRPESCIADLIHGKKRAAAGFTVPPHGLALMTVHYESDLRV